MESIKVFNSFKASSVLSQLSAKIKPDKKSLSTASSLRGANVAEISKTCSSKLVPLHQRALEFKSRVAVCDHNGSFLYDDLYRRSADLAQSISDTLKPNHEKQYKIGLWFPNGGSRFVMTKWACWMSGNIAVPLHQDTGGTMEQRVAQDCELVVAPQTNSDEINSICKRNGTKLICLDETWTADPRRDVLDSPLPTVKSDLNSGAIMLFHPESRRKIVFTHAQLAAQMESLALGWDLNEKCSVLHALPLNNLYGLVSSMMTPLSVGGKVVLLPNFDTIKVWAHLLGIGVDSNAPQPKINFYPSLPWQYRKLLDRYDQVFKEKKAKDYVKHACAKRIRAMISGYPLTRTTWNDWHEATGHAVADSYTSADAGTILSSKINGKHTKRLELLPGVEAKIVRVHKRHQSSHHKGHDEGDLMIRSAGCANSSSQSPNGWVNTGETARIVHGRVEIL